MGVATSSIIDPRAIPRLPFNQWSAYDVGVAAAALLQPDYPSPCIDFFVHNDISGKLITSMPNLAEVSNLLFRCGNSNILHHRILRLFLTQVSGGLPCEHPFIVKMGDQDQESPYICFDCKCKVLDAARIQTEQEREKLAREKEIAEIEMKKKTQSIISESSGMDSTSNDVIQADSSDTHVAPVGVSVAWLVHWTQEHNCWHFPTWLVRRLLVIPVTSSSNTCYFDFIVPQPETFEQKKQQIGESDSTLNSVDSKSDPPVTPSVSDSQHTSSGPSEPSSSSPSVVGPAHTFVCHSWSDQWGDLVNAITKISSNWQLKVYLDIFSTRPYDSPPTPTELLNSVIMQCRSFLLVCRSFDYLINAQHLKNELTPEQSKQLLSPSFWTFSR